MRADPRVSRILLTHRKLSQMVLYILTPWRMKRSKVLSQSFGSLVFATIGMRLRIANAAVSR